MKRIAVVLSIGVSLAGCAARRVAPLVHQALKVHSCMNDAVRKVVADCCRTVLMDEPWQDLGFSKRPRHGAFFQRFRPAWRVALEKKALQEMLAVFTAAHVIGGLVRSGDIAELVNAYSGTPELARAMGFESRDNAQRQLRDAVERYIHTPSDQWSSVLCSRIDPNSVPDRTVAARLFLGCAQFGLNVQRMVNLLK